MSRGHRHPLSKDGRHWAVGKSEKPASVRAIRRQSRAEIWAALVDYWEASPLVVVEQDPFPEYLRSLEGGLLREDKP